MKLEKIERKQRNIERLISVKSTITNFIIFQKHKLKQLTFISFNIFKKK
jgi:hypothetical protein